MPARIRLTPDQLDFRRYLLELYPHDLQRVALHARRPHPSDHLQRDGGIVLQPALIDHWNPVLRRMTPGQQDMFAVGLAWQVWFDEAAWAWHPGRYAEFRSKTFFPKLIGNCRGACRSHLEPAAALAWVCGTREITYVPPNGGLPLETRLARSALLAWTVPAVESIAQDLADEVPLLQELFEPGLAEFRITRPEHRIPPDDLLPTTPVRSWQMPRISREELRQRAEARRTHGHAAEPRVRRERPVRTDSREREQGSNGELFAG